MTQHPQATTTTPTTGHPLSGTKVGKLDIATPVTLAAGQVHPIDFTGGTITVGGDIFSPGAALPLALSISSNGNLVLPDDDSCYDIYAFALIQSYADADRLVSLTYSGWNVGDRTWVPIEADGALTLMHLHLTDLVPVGDGPAEVSLSLDLSRLTADVLLSSARLLVRKR